MGCRWQRQDTGVGVERQDQQQEHKESGHSAHTE